MKHPAVDVFMPARGLSKTFVCACVMMFSGALLCAQSRQAVLVRGNNWVTENNPFTAGVYTSLFGEYLIDDSAANSAPAPAAFSVRVSGDNSLLSGELWQPRPGAAAFLQSQDEANRYIGFPFAGGADLGTWTILFQFPLANNAVDDAEINRLIEAWTDRFRYFFSLIKLASDISLPAVVRF